MNENQSHIKVVTINETYGWDPAIVARAGGAIFGLYLYDSLKRTHCCEITPSYALNLIGSIPYQFPEDEAAREALENDLRDGDATSDNLCYFHCGLIDDMTPCHDFGIQLHDEDDDPIKDALEYCHANSVEPMSLPSPGDEQGRAGFSCTM